VFRLPFMSWRNVSTKLASELHCQLTQQLIAATLPLRGKRGEVFMADDDQQTNSRAAYWKANLSLLFKLLAVWFIVSFGFGILLKDWLDQFVVMGFKLGFWFAQQGSIYVFVALIFIYARKMRQLDRDFGVDD
jgi:putative solute:sodium symporter small subunit